MALIGCRSLRLKCTKIDFFWGSFPDPVRGAYNALPDLLAGFKGPYFQGKGGGKDIASEKKISGTATTENCSASLSKVTFT